MRSLRDWAFFHCAAAYRRPSLRQAPSQRLSPKLTLITLPKQPSRAVLPGSPQVLLEQKRTSRKMQSTGQLLRSCGWLRKAPLRARSLRGLWPWNLHPVDRLMQLLPSRAASARSWPAPQGLAWTRARLRLTVQVLQTAVQATMAMLDLQAVQKQLPLWRQRRPAPQVCRCMCTGASAKTEMLQIRTSRSSRRPETADWQCIQSLTQRPTLHICDAHTAAGRRQRRSVQGES